MFDKIIEPTLVIDKRKCLLNISRMSGKANSHNLLFCPHFKTHQSLLVGEWFHDLGITAITVSSVSMAQYFGEAGWHDITIAFPLNPREINRINEINPNVSLNLTVENPEALGLAGQRLTRQVGVFIKIDTGYNRTGIRHSEFEKINVLLNNISRYNLTKFKGFLIHAGHTYQCSSENEVLDIHIDSLKKIKELKEYYQKAYPDLVISYGDTPSCSIAGDFTGIDEIRPGNFAYYDLMQVNIGSCSLNDIAVVVACPVVAKHPERKHIVLYGGAVHFSKEYYLENGRKVFGKSIKLDGSGLNHYPIEGTLINLSQEHGILELTDPIQFNQIQIGELVYILPVHSCLTANLLRSSFVQYDTNINPII